MDIHKVTIPSLLKKKKEKKKISVLTAYDYPMARLMDEAGIDILLIGDSMGMVLLGYENTLPVTMDEMLPHIKAVSRATRQAMVIADMPFMSYQAGNEEAVRNAGRMIKEGGADGVKIEGGLVALDQIAAVVRAGIPVMGHIGLTPQSISLLGGYRVQGKTREEAVRIVKEASALEQTGVFSIVLECIPGNLAGIITDRLLIPTIGIGAGPSCDGQVLVSHDMLGMFSGFTPRHTKKFADLNPLVKEAFQRYRSEVEEGLFPGGPQSFTMDEQVAREIENLLNERS
ncbi:MAG: 3-methyl-2-oxobutanoate hydroxymethyltransferase [bacterium]